MSTVVHTQCRICAATCGLDVTVDREQNRVLRIAPDKANPYSWKDFCAKGRTAAQLVEHPQRIVTPMRRAGDRYEAATYAEAIADIASRLNAIIERDGPDAVGSYTGNPAGFSLATTVFLAGLLDAIGTHNRYWVGSIDQNGEHIVAELMYGSPIMTLVTDIDDARCVLLVGTNPAVSAMNWLDSSPDGWRRLLGARTRGADLIVVDPRRTESADHADTHLAVRPGQDWALLLALVKIILDEGWEDAVSCAAAHGVDAVRALAATADLGDLASRCDVPVADLRDVAERFARAPTGFCVTRTGVAHTEAGTVAMWLGHVLNLVCGRIDAPGGRRYERGVIDLPALFGRVFGSSAHRSRLRDLPAVAGFHSLAELADEITTPGPGQIKAMVIVAGNPVVSGPDGAALDEALASLDLLVAVDLVQRESHRHADWLLPAGHWLESEEVHLLLASVQERPFVQLAPRAVDLPPGVKPEWELFTDLALAMRRPFFGHRGINSLVRSSRIVSRGLRRPGLAFGPRWVERGLVATSRRVGWRKIAKAPHGLLYAEKEFGGLTKALRTPDKRIHAAPELLVAEAHRLLATAPVTAPAGHPLQMVNRRRPGSMNSWLNDLPGLHARDRTNHAEVHPADAAAAGLADGDLALVSSPLGGFVVPVAVTDAVRQGTVCVEHGWGSRVFDPTGTVAATSFGANRNQLTDRRSTDPLSQVPAFNTTWVSLEAATAGDGPSGEQLP